MVGIYDYVPEAERQKYYGTPTSTTTMGEGSPFYVGATRDPQGGKFGGGRFSNGGGMLNSGGGFGGPPMSYLQGTAGFDAMQGAYWQQQQAQEAGLNRLNPGVYLGQGYGGGLGNQAMQGYTNPQGIPSHIMDQQRRMLADLEAGSRENALSGLDRRLAASGWGDSPGAAYAQAQIRSGSAANLANQWNQLAFEDARMAKTSESTAAGLLAALAGAESDRDRAYAQAQMNRTFPAIPGITPGAHALPGQPAGSQWKYLNERGEIMPLQGWTPAMQAAAMQERMRYEQQQAAQGNRGPVPSYTV